MLHYQKTALGINVLQDRSLALTARQRRLLLLIGTEDFDFLNVALKERLAPHKLIQQLLDLGLIDVTPHLTTALTHEQIPRHVDLAHSDIQMSPPPSHASINALVTSSIPNTPTNEKEQPLIYPLTFEETKILMMETLQYYCGLMAKYQIQQISQSHDTHQLKQCQMQWITALQESRLAPIELNLILKQINYALDQLHAS